MMRARQRLIAMLAVVTLCAGCGTGGFGGLYQAPLPGGADLGPHPYRVSARFADVLDLVPQASVKVNGVDVGKVTSVELLADNKTAQVDMEINGDAKLPANATAALTQSSLLGEKYVDLKPPKGSVPVGTLGNGSVIPLDRTNRFPEVEEVLGALSLLLNGGNLGKINTIVKELNNVMGGNEPQLKAFLANANSVVTDLDSQRGQIVRAIDGLNKLSKTFAGQTKNINNALDNLGPGIKVLNSQRDQLVAMLKSLTNLSTVAVGTINGSKADVIADLKALQPVLSQLAKAGNDLPKASKILLTYPFSSYALHDLKGDWFNTDAQVNFDLSDVLDHLGKSRNPIIKLPAPNLPGGASGPQGSSKAPTQGQGPALPGLPSGPTNAPQSNGLGGVLGKVLGGGG
jgi:phospholipid/cholesterol/gamma-HCH transport system substrate-binding protein